MFVSFPRLSSSRPSCDGRVLHGILGGQLNRGQAGEPDGELLLQDPLVGSCVGSPAGQEERGHWNPEEAN